MTMTAYGYEGESLTPVKDEPVEIVTNSIQDAAIEVAFHYGYDGFIIKRTGAQPVTTFWLNDQPSGVPRKVTRAAWSREVIK